VNRESSVEDNRGVLETDPTTRGKSPIRANARASAETSPIDLDYRLASALSSRYQRTLQHQADAIEVVRDGDNVVLATPTASGKSLAYTVPALERALDHHGKTLYIAPMNALINDQEILFPRLLQVLGSRSVDVATYTGLLTDSEKREVWARQPDVLLTTPDMIHKVCSHILNHQNTGSGSSNSSRRSSSTKYTSSEDIRKPRLTGSVVSRLAEYYDSTPQYICCSATIGNQLNTQQQSPDSNPANSH